MQRLVPIVFLLPAVCAAPAAVPRGENAPSATTASTKSVTQADLLNRLIDVDRLYTPPAGERTGMFSSSPGPAARGAAAQTASKPDSWGHFLRTQPDGWSVMADINGPGALTRIWSPNPQGQVRIVLDETTSFELNFADLFSGRTPPFEDPLCYMAADGGQVCYFPIGFGKSCRVLARNCNSCYEINYVLFPPGTAVQTFARELDEPAWAALDAVTTALNCAMAGKRPAGEIRTYALSNAGELKAGEKLEAESFSGGGIIRALQVAITDGRPPEERYLLHQFILRIYFDGQEQPAVEAPLIDFFGCGLALTRFCSLMGGTNLWTDMPGEATSGNLYRITQESNFLYCYFPMPFADVARIEIEAPPDMPKFRHVGLRVYARIQQQPPPARALQFHARFRAEDPCQGREYPILETRGPGRIVGCVLNAASPHGGWGAAAGERIWVNGQSAPLYRGTSVAGLIGGTLGPTQSKNPPVQPLHGVSSSGPFGKCSGYRWFVPDSIEFEQYVRFALENGTEGGAPQTCYSTVVYWYAGPQAGEPTDASGRRLFRPLTTRELTPPPLSIAGAVEVEGHVLGQDSSRVLKEKYANGNELSGGLAAIISSTEPVQINIPSERQRVVLLTLRMHQLGSYYFHTVKVIDPAGKPLATIEYDRNSGIYPVGRVRLKAGDNVFSVVCSKRAVFDCWILQDAPPDEPSSAPSAP